MAFLGRFGNLLRRHAAAAANINMQTQISSEKRFFQTVRRKTRPSSTPTTKLFVAGLSYSTTDDTLWETFGKYGNVVIALVLKDMGTGFSRGFGVVSYPTVDEATRALKALNGQVLDGRRIRINYREDQFHDD